MKKTVIVLALAFIFNLSCMGDAKKNTPKKTVSKAEKVDKLIGTMHGSKKKAVTDTLNKVNSRHRALEESLGR